MKNGERLSLEQIGAFLQASEEFRFEEASQRKEIYDWVTRTLVEHEYHGQAREAKGVLRRYIGKMTGLSRAQVTRLIGRYQQSGMVKERGYRRNRFARRYTPADIEQLAAVDEAHETLSGPATQKILYRAYYEYGDERYRRLSTISVPHIYNLRKSRAYRDRKICYQKTRPVRVSIGERRRPDPQGNGLVEARNGAVIRKHMGYDHIESRHAEVIEEFYEQCFNTYLNFHRPCGVPEVVTNGKGKHRKIYRWYATPWEILRQLPDMTRHPRLDMTRAELERQASADSDTEVACRMQDAGSQGEAVCRIPAEKKRMKTAVEMGKPKTGFPTFPCHGLLLPTKFRKEAWRRSFAPPPGSLFD